MMNQQTACYLPARRGLASSGYRCYPAVLLLICKHQPNAVKQAPLRYILVHLVEAMEVMRLAPTWRASRERGGEEEEEERSKHACRFSTDAQPIKDWE